LGVGLGLLVARWDGATGPDLTRTFNPGDPAGPGQSPDAASRIADLKARLALNPRETSTLLALAHLYLDAGRYAEAIPLYQEVLRHEPENPDALMHMGTILLRGGHGEEALRYLDRALKISPDNAHALWDKAQAQATLLDDAGALRTWEQFLKVAPGPEDAARAREMMAEARSRMQQRAAGAASVGSGAPASRPVAGPAPGLAGPEPHSPAPDDPTVQAARELLARIGAGPPAGTAGKGSRPGDTATGTTSGAGARATPAAAHPGERLFWQKGCGGCHAIRGVGGQTAPDLAGRARSRGRDMVWHVHFLKEPAAVLPGTRMPSYRHLSEHELRTLAEYLVSL
jgi:tetratricopeptide (TPR) repeat protein